MKEYFVMNSIPFPENFGFETDLGPSSNELLDISLVGKNKQIGCNHYTRRPKGRRDWQIIYIYNGYGYFQFDDEVKKVGPCSLVVYRPGEPQIYAYYHTEMPDTSYIHFSGTIVEDLLNKYNLLQSTIYTLDSDNHIQLQKSFSKLTSSIALNSSKIEFCWGDFINFLSQLSLSIVKENKSQYSLIRNHKHDLLNVINEMQDNLSSNKRLKEYAKIANMSPSNFSHIFASINGISPMKYKNNLRIEAAKSLLMTTQLNIESIAEELGFSSVPLFINNFSKITGYTPKQYRLKFSSKSKND